MLHAFTSIIDKTKYCVNRVRHKMNAENWRKIMEIQEKYKMRTTHKENLKE